MTIAAAAASLSVLNGTPRRDAIHHVTRSCGNICSRCCSIFWNATNSADICDNNTNRQIYIQLLYIVQTYALESKVSGVHSSRVQVLEVLLLVSCLQAECVDCCPWS